MDQMGFMEFLLVSSFRDFAVFIWIVVNFQFPTFHADMSDPYCMPFHIFFPILTFCDKESHVQAPIEAFLCVVRRQKNLLQAKLGNIRPERFLQIWPWLKAAAAVQRVTGKCVHLGKVTNHREAPHSLRKLLQICLGFRLPCSEYTCNKFSFTFYIKRKIRCNILTLFCQWRNEGFE